MSDFAPEQPVSTGVPAPLTDAARGWAGKATGRAAPLIAAFLFLAVFPFALAVDCWLAQWCRQSCPDSIRRALQLGELFGHGLGILLVLLIVHQLDPLKRRWLPRALLITWGAGLAADAAKLIVARTRPHHFDFHADVWQTFIGWLPLASSSSGQQSFPSAHTATAVGLAWALGWLYPQGRRLFVFLAVLVATQRLASGAHYLSDALAGAAVGCLVAAWLGPLGRD